MRDGGGDADVRVTRRRLLAALAAGGLGGVAGCSTGENDVTSSSQVLGHAFPGLPEGTQLNPWSTGYPSGFHSILFESLSVERPGADPQPGDLVESVTIEGPTVTVQFDDGFSWWNGEPVTARDRWVADRIAALRGQPRTPDVTLVDEYTLEYQLDRPLARTLVFERLLNGMLDTAAWLFEPWVERLADAATETQRESVMEELQGYTISLDEAAEEGFGCGPYELVEVSPNRLMLERFDDHPRADDIAIPRLWFPVTMGEKRGELIEKGWLDLGGGSLANTGVSVPDNLEQLARFPTTEGRKLILDWRNVHLARRDVRRALVCAFPFETIVDAAGWGRPATLQTGLTRPTQRRWLDQGLRDELHRYPVEADHERAASYLRDSGYEQRRGDQWYDPDGRRMTLRVLASVQQGGITNLVRDAFENFGINIELDQISATAFLAVAERRNYDMILWWADGRPTTAYDVSSTSSWTLGYDTTDPSAETAPNGRPIAPTIPEDPGALESDQGQTVNLVEQWRRIRRPTSRAETADAVSLFARWWNFDVPDIDVATTVAGVWGNTRDFTWPDDGDPAFRTADSTGLPAYHLMKTGAIRPAPDAD